MDDNGLISAVSHGDPNALRELFNRHAAWIAARLRRTLPRDVVEDVLQETFLEVWRGAATYKGEGELGAWLWGIARRQAALWSRKNRRPEANYEPAVSEGLDDRVSKRVDLRQALTTLGPEGNERRELARLRFVEDRPIVEVAAILGIPEGTVKSRAYKIRRLLQAVLRKGGY